MTSVEVVDATPEHRSVLARLFELYQYDFSEWDGEDVGDDGCFGPGNLDAYWTDRDRHPYLLRVDGHWAGFALVRSGAPHDMAEFFVMRKFRRRGTGRDAARAIFARFPGEWQVRQMRYNPKATAFWRNSIPVPFEDDANDDGPVQRFVIE
jgi:predicted acetyltransferase